MLWATQPEYGLAEQEPALPLPQRRQVIPGAALDKVLPVSQGE